MPSRLQAGATEVVARFTEDNQKKEKVREANSFPWQVQVLYPNFKSRMRRNGCHEELTYGKLHCSRSPLDL